jgi:hypothetical protein
MIPEVTKFILEEALAASGLRIKLNGFLRANQSHLILFLGNRGQHISILNIDGQSVDDFSEFPLVVSCGNLLVFSTNSPGFHSRF